MCGKSVQVEARPPFSASNPFKGKIISNERVTSSEHFQDVRLLRVKVSPDVVYDAGDVVMVMPENSKQEVDELLDLLNLDTKWHRPGSMLLISPREDNVTTRQFAHLPTRLSLRKLITKYLSIHSVPKRSFFELLWKFSPDEIEREKLREFASTLGQEELYAYCLRPKRTALEVLADFPHTAACVTLEHLFDLFGAIKPRSFSIASSYSAHNDEVHILAALVEYRTTLKKPRVGLCSSFLATRREGDELDLWINKGTFVVPPPEVPIIMVGPGTGVAPFRSIIYERMAKRVMSPVRRQDVLFFGCRLRGADFYFEEEWSEMSHCLTTVVAFSRESADTKVYVQDKMWQEKDLVGSLILRGCVILVAGKSKQMPQDVRDTLARIVSSSQPDIDVDMFLNKLEQSKRLQYECWS
ncbi:NADPH-dependent diflavin oxidoreductase 1 [Halotydeus destructor]|nr:NADPH-dependent diflavin oxidoreductase 1 [Halotydeus destructor]